MTVLQEIFGPQGQITWWQECARAVIVFAYGLAIVRLAGRRVFGKWSALDIVVSIIVGSNLSRALTGSAALFGTLLATTLMMVLHWVLAHAASRSAVISHVLEGRSARLAANGQSDPSALHWHSISEADLNEALRQSGVEQVAGTRLIMLEPSGKITVLKEG